MAKILIADDSAVMRRNLRFIFTNAGHEIVAEAINGKEAFLAFKKYKPDLVTMDISMPEFDGINGVKMIINDYPDANIVMITTLSQKNLVYEAVKSGAKNYITKPIDKEKVNGVINDVLSELDD
ncbi:MAG: response regulator [Clostridiales bacterium]